MRDVQIYLKEVVASVDSDADSPILMTFPGATILSLDGGEIHQVALEDTPHYQITRGILEAPERYWKHLRG